MASNFPRWPVESHHTLQDRFGILHRPHCTVRLRPHEDKGFGRLRCLLPSISVSSGVHVRSYIRDLIVRKATTEGWHAALAVGHLRHDGRLLEAAGEVLYKRILSESLLGLDDVVAARVARGAVGGEHAFARTFVGCEGRAGPRNEDSSSGRSGGNFVLLKQKKRVRGGARAATQATGSEMCSLLKDEFRGQPALGGVEFVVPSTARAGRPSAEFRLTWYRMNLLPPGLLLLGEARTVWEDI